MRTIGPSVYKRARFPQFLWPRMEPTLTVRQATVRRVRAPHDERRSTLGRAADRLVGISVRQAI